MLDAIKSFQLQRLEDLTSLGAIGRQAWQDRQLPPLDAVPESALYTIAGIIAFVQFTIILLTSTGRRVVFITVDTVLAVLLITVLLAAILSLPIGAVYIGVRGTLLMARSLADNFPILRAALSPLVALLGQSVVGGGPGASRTDGAAPGSTAAATADVTAAGAAGHLH